jgi:hypothetical protein
MTIFRNNLPLSPIPDYLTIPQFFLRELESPGRPVRPRNVPYFIDNESGRAYNYEEVGLYAASYGEAYCHHTRYTIGPLASRTL